jgi:thioredoxin-like negative regulator of GroEL
LDKVAGLYNDKLRVLKVDSDEEPRIASALKVYGLPTIFFIKVRTGFAWLGLAWVGLVWFV